MTGKEKLFLEVARTLKRKLYVVAAKLHLLQCLGLSEEDMQLFTANEMESHVHVVPMWTIASFKRMKYISNQYSVRRTINLGNIFFLYFCDRIAEFYLSHIVFASLGSLQSHSCFLSHWLDMWKRKEEETWKKVATGYYH